MGIVCKFISGSTLYNIKDIRPNGRWCWAETNIIPDVRIDYVGGDVTWKQTRANGCGDQSAPAGLLRTGFTIFEHGFIKRNEIVRCRRNLP